MHLNASHFSIFASSNFDESLDTLNALCVAKEGTEELFAVRRDNTDERIYVNVAIHLDNRKDFMGEVVKPEFVECLSSTGWYLGCLHLLFDNSFIALLKMYISTLHYRDRSRCLLDESHISLRHFRYEINAQECVAAAPSESHSKPEWRYFSVS